MIFDSRMKIHVKSMWSQFDPELLIASTLEVRLEDVIDYLVNSEDTLFRIERPVWALRVIANNTQDTIFHILKGNGQYRNFNMIERLELADELRDRMVSEIFKSIGDHPELALYQTAHLTIMEIAQKFKTTPDAVADVLNRQMSAKMLITQE